MEILKQEERRCELQKPCRFRGSIEQCENLFSKDKQDQAAGDTDQQGNSDCLGHPPVDQPHPIPGTSFTDGRHECHCERIIDKSREEQQGKTYPVSIPYCCAMVEALRPVSSRLRLITVGCTTRKSERKN